MPKIRGRREKRHQPFWDLLIRGNVGSFEYSGTASTIGATNNLFTSSGGGNLGLTNMEAGGTFPSMRLAA